MSDSGVLASDALEEPSSRAFFGIVAGQVGRLPVSASDSAEPFAASFMTGASVGGSRNQAALRAAGVNCYLPRTTESPSKIVVFGTAACSATRLGEDVLGVTASVWFEGDQSETRVVWPELRRDAGRCVLTRRVNESVNQLSKRLEGAGQLDDAGPTLALNSVAAAASRDVSSLIQAGARRRNGASDVGEFDADPGSQNAHVVPARRFQVVLVADKASAEGPSEPVTATSAPSVPALRVTAVDPVHLTDESGHPTLQARIVVGGAAGPADFANFLAKVSENILLILANWRRLDCASDYFRRQVQSLKKITESSSPTKRLDSAREVIRLRTELAIMSANWTYDEQLVGPFGLIRERLEGEFALAERWRDALRRQDELGQLVQSAMELPEAAPPPPKVRSADEFPWVWPRNPLTQIAALVRHRREQEDLKKPPLTKVVALHPFANRDAIFQELQGTLMVTTMMTATTGIILGLLLQQSFISTKQGNLIGIPIDVVYLFVATFSFFLATLISTNAIQQLARETTVLVDVDLDRAAIVSEYLGKYCFLIAIPAAVIRYLPRDTGLTLIVAFLGWLTFVAYHSFPRIARIYRDVGDEAVGSDLMRDVIIYLLIGLLGAMLVFAQLGVAAGESISGGLLLAVLVLLAAFAMVLTAPADRDRLEVDAWDELGREARIAVPKIVSDTSKKPRPPMAMHRLKDFLLSVLPQDESGRPIEAPADDEPSKTASDQ